MWTPDIMCTSNQDTFYFTPESGHLSNEDTIFSRSHGGSNYNNAFDVQWCVTISCSNTEMVGRLENENQQEIWRLALQATLHKGCVRVPPLFLSTWPCLFVKSSYQSSPAKLDPRAAPTLVLTSPPSFYKMEPPIPKHLPTPLLIICLEITTKAWWDLDLVPNFDRSVSHDLPTPWPHTTPYSGFCATTLREKEPPNTSGPLSHSGM